MVGFEGPGGSRSSRLDSNRCRFYFHSKTTAFLSEARRDESCLSDGQAGGRARRWRRGGIRRRLAGAWAGGSRVSLGPSGPGAARPPPTTVVAARDLGAARSATGVSRAPRALRGNVLQCAQSAPARVAIGWDRGGVQEGLPAERRGPSPARAVPAAGGLGGAMGRPLGFPCGSGGGLVLPGTAKRAPPRPGWNRPPETGSRRAQRRLARARLREA